MSIAVSAVVCPSRILSALVGAMVLIAACVAIAIATGQIGDLSLRVRWPLSALLFFLASFGFYHGMCTRKTIQLDISGTGQIRLRRVECDAPCTDINRPHVRAIGELVRLMDNSTVWPHMLLLRFRSKNGHISVLPVMFDSVDQEAFRALSIACRWISTRNETPDANIF